VRHKLIDWVDAKCRLYGCSMRRIYVKDQNWPESVWARIQDGIPPCDFSDQRFLEVHEGPALEIARLMPLRVFTENQRTAIYIHYVIPGQLKQKLFRIGKKTESHYETLAGAHRKIANADEHGYLTKWG
jgi:hypothetical protein